MLSKSKVTLIVSLLTVVQILSGCAGPAAASKDVRFTPTQSGVVKAMTFNIRVGTAWWDGPNRWNKRKQMVFDTIEDNAADVVGLQEALGFQLQQINQTMPQYATYAIGRDNGKKRGEACTILYRKDRFELSAELRSILVGLLDVLPLA